MDSNEILKSLTINLGDLFCENYELCSQCPAYQYTCDAEDNFQYRCLINMITDGFENE